MKAIRDKYNALAMQAGKAIAHEMAGTIDSAAIIELQRLSGQSEVSANLSQWLASTKRGLESSAWVSLVAAGVCQSVAMALPLGWPKVALFATATATAAMSYQLDKQSKAVSPLLATANTIEAAKTMQSLMCLYDGNFKGNLGPSLRSANPGQNLIQQSLQRVVAPVASGANQESRDPRWKGLKFFDWNELRNGDMYPHLAVLGATGGGKTFSTERIVTWLCPNAERVKVLTTKRKADQWVGWTTIGPVRDFNKITLALKAEIADMEIRLGQIDDPSLIETWTIFDEVPAIAAGCGETWAKTASSLIREARESKKRCCFLIQGKQVKLIGLEGQSDLRENLAFIRLGKFALIHAQDLVRAKQADPLLLEWVEAQQYPLMVEDKPAYLPPEVAKVFSANQGLGGNDTELEDEETSQDLDTASQPMHNVRVPPVANI